MTLPLGLAFVVGAIAGYAVCLWRWCSAEEAYDRAMRGVQGVPGSRDVGLEPPTSVQGQGRPFTNIPHPSPGATQTRIYGGRGVSFMVAHDCLVEGCRTPHGAAKARWQR